MFVQAKALTLTVSRTLFSKRVKAMSIELVTTPSQIFCFVNDI